MTGVLPPFPYVGAKVRLTDWILSYFPPHRIYVEPFGGSGTILLAKEPSPVEIFNDLNEGIINLYRVLQDKEKRDRLIDRYCSMPFSESEFKYSRDYMKSPPTCYADWEHAYHWYYCAVMAFSGNIGREGRSVTMVLDTQISTKIDRASGRLKDASDRLKPVRLMCRDAIRIIKSISSGDCLLYLDPPYTHDSTGMRYLFDVDQPILIDSLLTNKSKIILSGYPNDEYKRLEENGWARYDSEIDSLVRTQYRESFQENKTRVESLWINPACQKAQRQLKLF